MTKAHPPPQEPLHWTHPPAERQNSHLHNDLGIQKNAQQTLNEFWENLKRRSSNTFVHFNSVCKGPSSSVQMRKIVTRELRKRMGINETLSFVSALDSEHRVSGPRQSEANCPGSRLWLRLGWGLAQALLVTLDPGLGETGRLETEAEPSWSSSSSSSSSWERRWWLITTLKREVG